MAGDLYSMLYQRWESQAADLEMVTRERDELLAELRGLLDACEGRSQDSATAWRKLMGQMRSARAAIRRATGEGESHG